MGKSGSSRVKLRHPVTWDRHTQSIAPVIGENANDDAATVITILANGVASISVTLDGKELIKQGGRIDHALPVAAESIQLVDAKNPLWSPQQMRVLQVPVGAHDENLTAFVGRAVQLELSGKNEKIAGVIESVSAKSIVLCAAPNAALLLVERAHVVAASLPGLVGASVVATLGATADDFAPVLTYTLPANQIVARAHYSVDIDRNDVHVVVVGSWSVSNRSSLAFQRARLFVEQALEPPRVEPGLRSNKTSNSIFSSVSKVKSNNSNSNNNSNRINRRNSNSGSDDEDDGDASLGVVRFQVPGLVDLPIETDVGGASPLTVPFGSAKTTCVVHNVVEFAKKTKVDAQHIDSAQAQFAVEFLLAAEAFGKAVPFGRATLWRAAYKSEPRRLITSIVDRVRIPVTLLPHWAMLSTNFAVHVQRTSSPLKMLPSSGDIESGEPVIAEQTVKFEFHNNVLGKGATLAIVDQDLEHYTRHAPTVPSSTRVTCKSFRDSTTVIKESDATIAAHAHTAGSLVLTVPITTRHAGGYELTYKIQFEIAADDNNGDTTSSTNDDGTPKPSGGGSSSNSATKTRVEKHKKSSWW